ncbi:hypothetical protein NBRC116599_42040 [Aquicoccus sp. SU-CL01552]
MCYWLSRFDRDTDCRDEIYSLIDKALWCVGSVVQHRKIKLVTDDPFLPSNRVLKIAAEPTWFPLSRMGQNS